jgi:hypothetical protein
MICLNCGYETEDKSNYKKHILTEKHTWYSSNMDEEKIQEMKNKGYHKCEYCQYITKRTDNLNRHIQNKHVGVEEDNIDGFKGKDKSNDIIKNNMKKKKDYIDLIG